AEHAGFSRAGLARENDALASLDSLDELFDDGLLARRKPKLVVGNLLGERFDGEAEEVEVQAHGSSSFLVAPIARSSSALVGSKGTRAAWGESTFFDERQRRALATG